MFDFFKKKFKKQEEQEPHYDPTNINILDLRKGFVLDYDFKTWTVEEEYEYDWGDNCYSYGFKLVSADDTIILDVNEADEVECAVLKPLAWRKIADLVEDEILTNERPPRKFRFEGREYFCEGEHPGYFRNVHADGDSIEFISWDYTDDSGEHVLFIEQWGERDFEAYVGKFVPERAFSNILPN
ncbi:MAG: hypothetical protein OHK0038_04430 [Flammeovirgaceae bacterium]